MSFLEMLDVVNEELIAKGEEPIAFDHDCREGICGTCGVVINGAAARPARAAPPPASSTCGSFKDGDELTIEPWRAQRLPGGQGPGRRPQRVRPHHRRRAASSRCRTGSAPDGNAIPVAEGGRRPRDGRRRLHRLRRLRGRLPERLGDAVHRRQGRAPGAAAAGPARARRARRSSMVAQMDAEGFGNCTNHGECEAACPKEIRSSSSRG